MKNRLILLTLLSGLLSAGAARAQGKELSKDLRAVVDGNNRFAIDMYRQIAQKPGNKFFSPYSISTALAMTYAGARGQTAREMAATLHFTLDNERLHPAFGELARKIDGKDRKRDFRLTTANSLWGNINLNPEFLRIMTDDYQSPYQIADFAGNTEGERKKINSWVEDKTNDKIKELLKPGIIKANTKLVLVNAIYFKASWRLDFPKGATKPEDFFVPGSAAVKVPMMNQEFLVDLMQNDDFQLVQIPYQQNEVSMVVVLPRKKDGLAEVEKKLSATALQQALAKVVVTNVKMSLPKFKMTEEFDLGKNLMALGMNDAFMGGVADFSGMEPSRSLAIDKVVHKAFVDVHEEGTEAAAATAVAIASSEPPPPIAFQADHPFLFLVRHNATGSILFMGRLNDPTR